MDTITVYRFFRMDDGRRLEPQHMWGTLEAIATLDNCVAMMETAREVPISSLDSGFVIGRGETISIHIDEV